MVMLSGTGTILILSILVAYFGAGRAFIWANARYLPRVRTQSFSKDLVWSCTWPLWMFLGSTRGQRLLGRLQGRN
jgi:hypothetical protein